MNNIFNIFPVIISGLKKDFPFYGVLIASVGGANQAIFLLQEPSLLSFYSIKQGIIDGALSVVFVIISMLLMFVTLKLSELSIRYINKKITYILHNIPLSIIFLYIILNGWSYEKFYLILFCILIFYAVFSIPYLDVDEPMPPKNPRETLAVVIILLSFALILFHTYLYYQHRDSTAIQNFTKMQNELNNSDEKYQLEYFNSEYIFFYNIKADKYKIVRVEEVVK